MKKQRIYLGIAAMIVFLSFISGVHKARANTVNIFVDDLVSANSVAPILFAGDFVLLDAVIAGPGTVNAALTFTLGSGVDTLDVGTVWSFRIGARLAGINIDLIDSANKFVNTDTFQGVISGFAISTLSQELKPGVYKLVLSGTAITSAVFDMELDIGGTPPSSDPVSTVPLPTSWVLFAMGLMAVGVLTHRRRPARARMQSVMPLQRSSLIDGDEV